MLSGPVTLAKRGVATALLTAFREMCELRQIQSRLPRAGVLHRSSKSIVTVVARRWSPSESRGRQRPDQDEERPASATALPGDFPRTAEETIGDPRTSPLAELFPGLSDDDDEYSDAEDDADRGNIDLEALAAASRSAAEDRLTRGLRVGRNEPCPCGSGKKYKRCCLSDAPR
jgi:hypothetical protein